MDLDILILITDFLLLKQSVGSAQFNGEIINMIFQAAFVWILTPRYLTLSVSRI